LLIMFFLSFACFEEDYHRRGVEFAEIRQNYFHGIF